VTVRVRGAARELDRDQALVAPQVALGLGPQPTLGRRISRVYLSLEEAAEVMSLSKRTIRRRTSDGTIPAYQCGRRAIRVRLDELEAALRRIPSARW
jgi:excisionase family DNA binding protein